MKIPVCLLLCLLCACNPARKEDNIVRVKLLRGPSAIAFAQLMDTSVTVKRQVATDRGGRLARADSGTSYQRRSGAGCAAHVKRSKSVQQRGELSITWLSAVGYIVCGGPEIPPPECFTSSGVGPLPIF